MTVRSLTAMLVATALASAIGVAGLVGCLPAAGVCRSSQECQTSEICVASHCHLTCNATPDCPPDEVCRNGICFAAGASDAAIGDVSGSESAIVDTSASDAAGRDAGHADGAAHDLSPVDRAAVDAARDAVHLDAVALDTVRSDTPQPDTAHADAARVDAAAPDARDAGIVPSDAAVIVDATGLEREDAGPPCPGVPPVRLCPASDPQLIACYTFDNDVGGTPLDTITDSSSYLNHGTLVAAVHGPGIDGQALNIDGASAVIVPHDPSLNPGNMLTIEAWVRLDAMPATRAGVVDKDGQYSMFIYQGASKASARCSVTSSATVVEYAGVVVGQWTHLACVYDGVNATYSLYQDGYLVKQTAVTNTIATATTTLALGGNSPSGDFLTGALDGVRLWSGVRSPADICWAARR